MVKIDGETIRCYKPGVLRGVLDDSGIAEEIVFGTLKTHDMEQCREMLRNTPCLRENDILINDRGFLSRETTNYLKNTRKVDTYIPEKRIWYSMGMPCSWLKQVENGRSTQMESGKIRKFSS